MYCYSLAPYLALALITYHTFVECTYLTNAPKVFTNMGLASAKLQLSNLKFGQVNFKSCSDFGVGEQRLLVL
jgi:hypothetical protein